MSERYAVMVRLSFTDFRDMDTEEVLDDYLRAAGFDLDKKIEITTDLIHGDLIYEQIGDVPSG